MQNPNCLGSLDVCITLCCSPSEMMHAFEFNCRGNLPRYAKGFNELVARRIIERQFFSHVIISAAPKLRIIILRSVPHLRIRVFTHYALSLSSRIKSAVFPLNFWSHCPFAEILRGKGPTLPGEQQVARRLFSPKLRPGRAPTSPSPSLGTRRRRVATSNPRPLFVPSSSRVTEEEGGLNTSVGRTPRRTLRLTTTERPRWPSSGEQSPRRTYDSVYRALDARDADRSPRNINTDTSAAVYKYSLQFRQLVFIYSTLSGKNYLFKCFVRRNY